MIKEPVPNKTIIRKIIFKDKKNNRPEKIQNRGFLLNFSKRVFFFIGDNCQSCQGNNYINTTLGWIMGFRELCYELSQSNPVSAEAVADLNGPKYLLLYLDEFNIECIISVHPDMVLLGIIPKEEGNISSRYFSPNPNNFAVSDIFLIPFQNFVKNF